MSFFTLCIGQGGSQKGDGGIKQKENGEAKEMVSYYIFRYLPVNLINLN